MKILVAVKRVIDPYERIRVKNDHSGVDKKNVKMAMNPFDAIAIEEAVRIKEQGKAEEIILVSIGDTACQETLRAGFAIGADRGIHVHHAGEIEPLNVAKILTAIINKEQVRLAILGKQAIDADNNQVAQMLAGLLNWPQGTFISAVAVEQNTVSVTREIDGGLEMLQLMLPAILSTDLRLNEPRYASLPNIMKAKSKPIEQFNMAQLGIQPKQHQVVLKVESPPKRQGGIFVNDVDELIEQLKQAGVM